jgi:hypothetical protein
MSYLADMPLRLLDILLYSCCGHLYPSHWTSAMAVHAVRMDQLFPFSQGKPTQAHQWSKLDNFDVCNRRHPVAPNALSEANLPSAAGK